MIRLRSFDWRHIPLLLVVAFAMAPLVLLVGNAFKSKQEFRKNPFGFPKEPVFQNLVDAWNKGGYGAAFMNSAIVCAVVMFVVCLFAGLAAYALSKLKFRASGLLMGLLLFVMSVPMGLFLVPLFFLWKNLGLMDNLLGIILIYSAIFLPFNIFFLRSFFVGIPNEIIESAKIDGCNDWRTIFYMIVPISKSAFQTVALLVGLWCWNEFFFANAFLQTPEAKTVATKYLLFTGRFSNDWTMISAAGLITILPIILLFVFMQRNFIDGITEGSLKG